MVLPGPSHNAGPSGQPQIGDSLEETAARPGSSVGTSVRLKIGRSAVRPRPWPLETPSGATAFGADLSYPISRQKSSALFSALSHTHNLWITSRDPAKIGRSRTTRLHHGLASRGHRAGASSPDPNVGKDRPDVGRALQVLQGPRPCERLPLKRFGEISAGKGAVHR